MVPLAIQWKWRRWIQYKLQPKQALEAVKASQGDAPDCWKAFSTNQPFTVILRSSPSRTISQAWTYFYLTYFPSKLATANKC